MLFSEPKNSFSTISMISDVDATVVISELMMVNFDNVIYILVLVTHVTSSKNLLFPSCQHYHVLLVYRSRQELFSLV